MNHKIPIINNSFSMVEIHDNLLVVSVEGEYRAIQCDKHILSSVLQAIDGEKNLEELITVFSKQYDKKDVEIFFEILFKEHVLIWKNTEIKYDFDIKLLLIGSGFLFEQIKDGLKKNFTKIDSSSLEESLSLSGFYYDTVVFISEDNTCDEVLRLNKKLMEFDIPFIVIYYNGKGITIGPYVFPYKTPCLECHMTQHFRSLKIEELSNFRLKDVKSLKFSITIPIDFPNIKIQQAANILFEEIKKIKMPNHEFEFYRCEKTLYADCHDFQDIKEYQAILDCECCHGMNKNFKLYSDGKISTSFTPLSELLVDEIKYRKGGFRSRSEQETKSLLENAFHNIGCEIKIRLMTENPFKEVLPVYDSLIEPTHNNKTPYFFSRQLSHGKGMDTQQAYFSAAFEILERVSARYYGEFPIYRATPRELGKDAIDLTPLMKQIRNTNTTYDIFSIDKPIDWVCGTSLLSGDMKMLPATMVFLSATNFRGKFVNATSSGLASGAVLVDAVLQGLLEIVEHDGWLIGQSNSVELPLIDYSTIANQKTIDVISKIESLGYKVISRDYSNDINIPVIRTWIINPKNYTDYATSGFGASPSAVVALERSITEAVQAVGGYKSPSIKRYESPNMRDTVYDRNSIYGLYYFQQKDFNVTDETPVKSMKAFPKDTSNSVKEMLDSVIMKIKKAVPNCDILFYNLTRSSIGVPVVRTIVTGDIQRMSLPLITVSPRLIKFQQIYGYSKNMPQYEQLYMGPYPH